MLDVFTVAFFGHRTIYNTIDIENRLEKHIRQLIGKYEYVNFLVGRNGDFDQCVSSSVLRIRKKVGEENSSLVLVLPYATAEYLNNQDYFEKYYTDIVISYSASNAHPKSAFKIRNFEMVDRADLVICYVENSFGGAYQAVSYAKRQGKKVINLAEFDK